MVFRRLWSSKVAFLVQHLGGVQYCESPKLECHLFKRTFPFFSEQCQNAQSSPWNFRQCTRTHIYQLQCFLSGSSTGSCWEGGFQGWSTSQIETVASHKVSAISSTTGTFVIILGGVVYLPCSLIHWKPQILWIRFVNKRSGMEDANTQELLLCAFSISDFSPQMMFI